MIKQAQQPFSLQHFGRLLFRHRKKASMYGLVFIAVSLNLCLFLPANMRTPAAGQMVTAIQLLCFAVMGIINVWFFTGRNFLAELAVSGARLAYISLLFIAMALVLFGYYFVTGNNSLVMAFASSGAFLLPFLIYQGYIEFMGIPAKNYPVWHLPETASGAAVLSAFTVNSIQLQLVIARTASDKDVNTIPVTVSAKTKLGRVFEKFIEDRRIEGAKYAIETKNDKDNSFGWQFYESKWMGVYQRWLNPSMSLYENKVRANATIIVIRVNSA